MRRMVICAIVVLLLPGIVHAFGGTTQDFTFTPASLGIARTARVYLPEGYDPGGIKRYPVIYFLHGANYDYPIYWSYFGLKTSLDTLIHDAASRGSQWAAMEP
jgi:enterochelin esterase-like enzyme